MDIQAHEKLMRLVANLEDVPSLLIFAAFTIRHINRLFQVDAALVGDESRLELLDARVNEGLGMRCIKKGFPCRVLPEELIVLGVAPIERKAGRPGAGL